MMSPLNRNIIDYERPTLIVSIAVSIYRVIQIFMQPATEHQLNYWWAIVYYFLTEWRFFNYTF